jgi:catechol 2,3-dioxygenase-like lactoylglutathione lyase family enzyme
VLVDGLDHVYYWTADMDRAVAFYRDGLGLSLLRREGDRWAEFATGTVRFGLHGRDGPVVAGGTVVFRVDDLDAARRTLDGRGIEVEGTGEVEGRARFVSVRDPDGNPVQLIEYR